MPLETVANLWTLTGHPRSSAEWTPARKIAEVKKAGFTSVTGGLDEAAIHCARSTGLRPVGWFWALDGKTIREQTRFFSRLGVKHVTVFLGTHDMPPVKALKLVIDLQKRADDCGLYCAPETHRDTATETPEKTAFLLGEFRAATGRELPVTWDFSHHALVKHLRPEQWIERLVMPFADNIIAAELFHFRPFNGHHAQIPARVAGIKTPEMCAFLDFVTAVMRLWRSHPANAGRTMLACPEVGPVADGYGLSHEPPPLLQAVILARDFSTCWKTAKPERIIK